MSKTCFKCGVLKPLDQFYRHPMMKDGHLGKCKSCARLDVRMNRWVKREQYNEYDRKRYREQNRRPGREPHKLRATQKLHLAVKRGKLVKPSVCSECGASGKIEGHHEDYSKPLDVVWLCTRCHDFRHTMKAA